MTVEALFESIKSGNPESVRSILLADKSLTSAKHKDASAKFDPDVELDAYKFLGAYIGACTPLQFAILSGQDSIARDILDRTVKDDLDITFGGGNTTLHLATFLGARDLVKSLLERGASRSVRNAKEYESFVGMSADKFVAVYVRDLLNNKEKTDRMMTCIEDGAPFCENEDMAMAMIDISGYSSLASLLEKALGKISSEVITEAVSSYMGKVSEIVFKHQGDIVKFLGTHFINYNTLTRVGDAILVTFGKHGGGADNQMTSSKRALVCCLEILSKHPTYEINIENWSQILKASSVIEFAKSDGIDTGMQTGEKTDVLDLGNFMKTAVLSLHVAVCTGGVQHVILGSLTQRLDYLIYSDSLDAMGEMLDGAKSGELSVSMDFVPMLGGNRPFRPVGTKFGVLNQEAIKSNYWRLQGSNAHMLALEPTIRDIGAPFTSPQIEKEAMKILETFINKSILSRLHVTRLEGSAGAIAKQAQMQRTISISSALAMRAEYRTVSIVFIKIHTGFYPEKAQKYLRLFLDKLEHFEGVFQQFSVDDKGQSILACFGLPPFVYENCALFAVHAVAAFALNLTEEERNHLSFAVTTGEILFGTDKGDVINVAARLVSMNKNGTLVIDDRTKDALKGKNVPIQIWQISSFRSTANRAAVKKILVQNRTERDKFTHRFRLWHSKDVPKAVLLVEGESGMGKSILLGFLRDLISENEIPSCTAHGSEVEQMNAYGVIRQMLVDLMNLESMSEDGGTMTSSMQTVTTRYSVGFEIQKRDVERILMETGENPAYAHLILEMVTGTDDVNGTKLRTAIPDFQTSQNIANAEGRKSIFKSILQSTITHLITKHNVALLLDDAQIETFGAVSVDPKLLEDIYNQCHGNLLHTDALIRHLLGSNEFIYVDEAGVLCAHQTDDTKRFLSRTVEMVVMNQFDVLHSDIQAILINASVLGQYFNLVEVLVLMGNSTMTPEDLKQIILKHDHYEYLKHVENLRSGAGNLGVGSGYEYFFRHISITNAIYQSIAFSERERLHFLIAEHYDQVTVATPSKKIQLLPLLCYHYGRTRNSAKILSLNAELGFEFTKSGHYYESVKTLRLAHNYLDDNISSMSGSLTSDQLYLLMPKFHCEILASLAFGEAKLKNFTGAKEAILRYLNFTDTEWPQTPKQIKKETIRSIKRLIQYWIKSNGGKRDIPISRKSPKTVHPDWFHFHRTALMSKLLVSLYGGLDKGYVLISIFWNLTHSLVTCETNPEYLFEMMMWTSFLFAQQGSASALRLSKWAIRQCDILRARCGSAIRTVFNFYGGLQFSFFCKVSEGIRITGEYEKYCLERRINYEIYAAIVISSVCPLYAGDLFASRRKVTESLLSDMRRISVFWLSCFMSNLQLECFFCRDTLNYQKYNAIEKEFESQVVEAFKIRAGSSSKIGTIVGKLMQESNAEDVMKATKDALDAILSVSVSVSHHMSTMTSLVSCIACTSLAYFFRSKLSSIPQLKDLITTISTFIVKLEPLARHAFTGRFAKTLCIVGRLHLMNARTKCVKIIRKFMKHPELKDRLGIGGEASFVGAICCALIGLSSSNENEARLNTNRAVDMFQGMKARRLVDWAEREMKFAVI
ncbi:hypothetical protein HDU97_002088 [Phlyctochytrium planicorne]|nr:hypothetical protein HDU97_002088 [Phlyctochytrium planicorne]